MVRLQRILLDLMSRSVKEIKSCGIDLGQYSVESLITWHGLKRWTQESVQPVWDLLTPQAKQTIGDLKELKKLAYLLIYSSLGIMFFPPALKFNIHVYIYRILRHLYKISAILIFFNDCFSHMKGLVE